ncbi:MAG: CBS domain-containing protein [Rhabdochlamydiaceae bacterium]|nr:CBS domain-containing protein [Rhabdochlamydiaceae bacterium]
MKIQDIMHKKIIHVCPNSSIQEVAAMMKEHGFSALPVIEQGHVTGIITRKDIIVRALACNKDPKHTKVNEIMTRKVYCVNEHENLDELAKKMAIHAVHAMPVLNDAKKIVGFVTIEDLVKRGDKDTWSRLVIALNRAA